MSKSLKTIRYTKTYFDSIKARRKKEVNDKLKELDILINQAKRRKEYHTILDLTKEYEEILKENTDLLNS